VIATVTLIDRTVTVDIETGARIESEGDDLYLQYPDGRRCLVFLSQAPGNSRASLVEVE
jgi:hypothetical protein